MGTVSVLGLAGAKSTPNTAPAAPENESADQPANRDQTAFADLGARIGEDNETLQQKRIAFAKTHTWENSVSELYKVIEQKENLN